MEIKAKTPSPSKARAARGELLPSLQTIQTYMQLDQVSVGNNHELEQSWNFPTGKWMAKANEPKGPFTQNRGAQLQQSDFFIRVANVD